jgi:hypothetical protein
MCTERCYTPVLAGSYLHSNLVTPDNSDVVNPPAAAKYVSPFGNTDAVPVVPDSNGRMRPAPASADRGGKINGAMSEHYFSLPNTPDTDDQYRGSRSRAHLRNGGPAMIKLATEVGGESYI